MGKNMGKTIVLVLVIVLCFAGTCPAEAANTAPASGASVPAALDSTSGAPSPAIAQPPADSAANALSESTAVPYVEPIVPSLLPPEEPQEVKDIFSLTIPRSLGQIREVYKGDPNRVIVHIQDAHCNYECQINIMSIIDLLVNEYGIRIAGIEGSSGRLQTELFSTFPDDAARAKAVDFSIREGKMSGPEALVIREGFEYPLELYGIEDPELYNNNFNAYKASYPFKAEAKYFFYALKRYLHEIKLRLYDKTLLEFDTRQTAFEKKELELKQYCLLLDNHMKKHQFKNKADYLNYYNFLKAVDIENRIDFNRAEEERVRLLNELTNGLPEEEIAELVDKGMAYRNESISAAAYLSFVKGLAVKNKIDFGGYKNLDLYIEYAASYDAVNSANLFGEISDIEEAIIEKYCKTEDQKKLNVLIKGLKVMERMVDIKMINRDLAFYQAHKHELNSDAYFNFIKIYAKKYRMNVTLPNDVQYLDVYIPAWVEFYRVAGLRDEAMIQNTLAIMRDNEQKIGIMVTGGFHTRELTRLMREQGVSYLVVTPRITQDVPGPYFDRLLGRKTEFESFIEALDWNFLESIK